MVAADVRLHRTLVILGLFILPLLIVVKQALFDPEIKFLPPSSRAGWALHPDRDAWKTREVEFARTFTLTAVPGRLELRCRAFDTMRLTLNGTEISPVRPSRNWKRAVTFDLSPYLRTGENHLSIRVYKEGVVPALLVESPKFLRTRGEWRAALEPGFDRFKPVASPLHVAPVPGPLQDWEGWKWAKWLAAAWLAGIAGVTLAALVHSFGGPRPMLGVRLAQSRWARVGIPLAVLGVCLWLNLTNASRYHYSRSLFDMWGHVDYVKRMAQTWTPLVASDGWQTYQPPLYYYGAGIAYRLSDGVDDDERGLKGVQYFGCLAGVGLAVLAWLLARRLFPNDPPAQWAALGFASFLPVSLYLNPVVTNEAFSATVIAGGLYCFVCWGHEKAVPVRRALLLGLLAGLALLSRFTGLFLFAAGGAALALRAMSLGRVRSGVPLAAFLGAGLLVCGWYYGRNVMIYGQPFVGNWDGLGIQFEYDPGYRSAESYFGFGSVFFHHPERARWTTWLDGFYSTLWSDGQYHFLEEGNIRGFFLAGVMLILAAFPSAAIAVGLGRTIVSALRRPALNEDFFILAVSIWTWISLVSFTMRIPTYSALKAIYFLSLVPILGVYLARGREFYHVRLRWARWVLDGTIILLCVLAVWIYRYPG